MCVYITSKRTRRNNKRMLAETWLGDRQTIILQGKYSDTLYEPENTLPNSWGSGLIGRWLLQEHLAALWLKRR